MSKKKYKGNIKPEEIAEKIKKAKEILITAHENPDGDALGSILAFYLMIEEYNKKYIKNEDNFIKVFLMIDDRLPKYMKHFEEKSLIRQYSEELLKKEFDLFISMDCANAERYGRALNIKEQSRESINIDHHISNTEHADFNYVEDVSSTAELIYQFLKLFGVEMTKKIGEFLYLGIINDTGNFRHDNITEETFKVCSEIMKSGVDNHKIADIIFEVSIKKINLIGDVYRNKTIDEKYGFIYYYLPYEKMKSMDIEKDETDGIAEMLLRIEGMELSLFLREESGGMIKGSLRCNDKYNVNEMASVFNGGGHVKAAGFKTSLSFEKIMEKIFYKLKEEK